jgi:hypothetical protein
VFESKRQETCALMGKKLRFEGPIVAKPQHPWGIISLSRGLPTIPIVMWPGGYLDAQKACHLGNVG